MNEGEAKIVEENLDKETRSINLMIFFMKLMGMWPVYSKKDRTIANLMLGLMIGSMFAASIIEGQDLFFSRKDFMLITYSAPCTVVVASEISKLTVFIVNRQKVTNLNKSVEDTFWKIKYTKEETKLFNECDQLCFKAITIYAVSLQGIGWHYVLAPAIESIGKDPSERKYPFPIYFDFIPVQETPYYQLIYASEIFAILAVSLCAITFASYLFAMNMFAATQFKILNMHLRELCDFSEENNQMESYNRLKDCIRKHQILIKCVDDLEDLFSFVMLVQIFGSVTQICFSGFQIILRTILSVEYLLGSLLQLYFYCYSSHEIYTESEKVAEAIYSSQWFRIVEPEIREDFTLMVQIIVHRARRPCILTVGKFCPLNLDTFSSVLRTSLSYFTVLRQTLE